MSFIRTQRFTVRTELHGQTRKGPAVIDVGCIRTTVRQICMRVISPSVPCVFPWSLGQYLISSTRVAIGTEGRCNCCINNNDAFVVRDERTFICMRPCRCCRPPISPHCSVPVWKSCKSIWGIAVISSVCIVTSTPVHGGRNRWNWRRLSRYSSLHTSQVSLRLRFQPDAEAVTGWSAYALDRAYVSRYRRYARRRR